MLTDIKILAGLTLLLSFAFAGLLGAIRKKSAVSGDSSGGIVKFSGRKALMAGLLTFIGMGLFAGTIIFFSLRRSDNLLFDITVLILITMASFLLGHIMQKTEGFTIFRRK